MVQSTWMPDDRRTLRLQNGYLGCRMRIFWNPFAIPPVSRRKRARLNTQNPQYTRDTPTGIDRSILEGSNTHETWFPTTKIRRYLETYSTCECGSTGHYSKNVNLQCWWPSNSITMHKTPLFQRTEGPRHGAIHSGATGLHSVAIQVDSVREHLSSWPIQQLGGAVVLTAQQRQCVWIG